MESYQGQLLVSNSNLYDPNFRHTVVLIGEHDEAGALGVVLNRPLDVTVAEAVPPLGEVVPPGEQIFQGGPVQPTAPVLVADLTDPTLADIPIFGSIGFLIGEVSEEATAAIRRARVFAGYSGWGAGQLEAEMAADSWLLDPARPDDVFTDDPDGLWSRVVRRKGPDFELLSRMPFDPRLN